MNTSCTRSLASKALYFNILTHIPLPCMRDTRAAAPGLMELSTCSICGDGCAVRRFKTKRTLPRSCRPRTSVTAEVILALLLRHNDPVRHANILRIVIFGGALLSSSTFHPHPLFPSPPHYKHPPPGANEGQTGLLDVGEKTYVLE